jgi:hypothetical protein
MQIKRPYTFIEQLAYVMLIAGLVAGVLLGLWRLING